MEFLNISPSPVYGIHNPVGLKYLTRLRVGLSHLRAHNFDHNFKDTTTKICSCQTIKAETVEHYLFYCPKCLLLRSELFGKLSMIISLVSLTSFFYTRNLLLYGYSWYDFQANKRILELTINFIISSKKEI